MAYPTARSEFKVKQSASRITGSLTYDVTLSGRGPGLRDLDYPVTRTLREIMGYYTGIRHQEDTGKATGTCSFNVDLVDATRFLLGKEGQYLYFEHKLYQGSTLKLTVTGEVLLESCNLGEDGDVFMIAVSGRLTKDITYRT
ncbi:MAG: hypothetical protein F4X35_00110 [Alphaproteobacteria bacterium]|nr:hypothetical protein [Alphaproteobacteria bacterium]